MATADVLELIRSLAPAGGAVTNRQIAQATGLTRQAIHYHLRKLTEEGLIQLVGRGRGARYVLPTNHLQTYPLEGLEEHQVWADIEGSVPDIARARDNVRDILAYALQEMVNNAIDHSSGSQVAVSLTTGPEELSFEVVDDGVGVFRHVMERFSLPDEVDAISHLAKGKQTTMPERHSGEGIFFSSRALDRFVLEGGETRWTVDNLLGDQAIADVPARIGTRVRGEIRRDSPRTLSQVFGRHTDPETARFSKTSVAVHLARTGDSFLSRSEARRLGVGLERFDEVRLDFGGVREVGQGFVDEVFRVWANDHPGTRLVPVNTSPNVGLMVKRAIARRKEEEGRPTGP